MNKVFDLGILEAYIIENCGENCGESGTLSLRSMPCLLRSL